MADAVTETFVAVLPSIIIDNQGRQHSIDELTDQQKSLLKEKIIFQHEHAGHEETHARMGLILLTALISVQFLIMFWKKYHKKSFDWASLMGLLIVPPLLAINAGNYRYLIIWFLFALTNFFVVRLAFEKPLRNSTPGFVYRFYAWTYTLSYIIGFFGLFITISALFRLPEKLFSIKEQSEIFMFQGGLIMLFYGLYFGCLGRDIVDRLSEAMAASIGYYNRKGFPAKHLRDSICAICGLTTTNAKQAEYINPTEEKNLFWWFNGILGHYGQTKVGNSYQLNCKHIYHESCIRGWTLIGKKDCCPYCKEKVNLKVFSQGSNPWDTTQLLYLNLLDALRYVIVWNPMVFFIIHYVFIIFDMK
ncbi:hypothetical protein HK099_002431 [Clydaea vesicula]|uniref:RING-type domain-containing protein n=1 Tax=Clydaea vesicula TaxID=447962 RepID=A0AAD5U7D8_9FUNG|nr:hypothetical protein HK099_002431 [Clydaea vesicula]